MKQDVTVIRMDGSVVESKIAYEMGLDAGLSDELALKYSSYFAKKTKIKKRGRVSYKDTSQTKVYRAEWAFEKKFPEVKEKLSEKETRKFFKNVVKSKTYKTLSKNNVPVLTFMKDMGKHTRTAGRAWSSEVSLSPNSGMNKYVIIHELAHTCGHMHHDISFRKDLLKLVSRFLGVKYAKGLKEEFKAKKLKMSISTNILSPLKWKESYDKMMKLREKL